MCLPARNLSESTQKNHCQSQKRQKMHCARLNHPNSEGEYILLKAIRLGKSISHINTLIELGADVNIKTTDGSNQNVVHIVVNLLQQGNVTSETALAVLNMVMENGFNAINEKDSDGFTGLHCLMRVENIDAKLLQWFALNQAEFNAVGGSFDDSILFHAIRNSQNATILKKILQYGGNPRYKNSSKNNALHLAASFGHQQALRILLDHVEANEINDDGQTPLHLLFSSIDVNYENALKCLLENGAEFDKKCNKGKEPLIQWLQYCKDINVFPDIWRAKDLLPITDKIASAALTTIIKNFHHLQQYLPDSSLDETTEFVQFVSYIIEEKNALLLLKNETEWKQQNWKRIEKLILTPSFSDELRTYACLDWEGDLIQLTPSDFGAVAFHTETNQITTSIETVLFLLLVCKEYKGFVEVVQLLKGFCGDV